MGCQMDRSCLIGEQGGQGRVSEAEIQRKTITARWTGPGWLGSNSEQCGVGQTWLSYSIGCCRSQRLHSDSNTRQAPMCAARAAPLTMRGQVNHLNCDMTHAPYHAATTADSGMGWSAPMSWPGNGKAFQQGTLVESKHCL